MGEDWGAKPQSLRRRERGRKTRPGGKPKLKGGLTLGREGQRANDVECEGVTLGAVRGET